MPKRFYEFKKTDDEDVTELYIYGTISSLKWEESDVGSYDFANELANIDNDLKVRINSYGGEVCEGLAMYSLLKDYGKNHHVTTVCDGFACSAASVVFMAGTRRVMTNASLLLIHNAWTTAQGDANELRKQADDLEKITEPSLDIYESVSNLSREDIKSLMDKETWITQEEALEWGFATDIEKESANQSIDERYYLNHAVHENKMLRNEIASLTEKLNGLKETEHKVAEETHEDKWSAFFNKKI